MMANRVREITALTTIHYKDIAMDSTLQTMSDFKYSYFNFIYFIMKTNRVFYYSNRIEEHQTVANIMKLKEMSFQCEPVAETVTQRTSVLYMTPFKLQSNS